MKGYKGPRFWFRYLEILQQIKDLPKDLEILEIGSGTLELASELAKENNITCVDLSDEIEIVRRSLPSKIKEKIRCIKSDFLKYHENDKKYDLVIAMEVLEHIKDEAQFLERIKKLSNPLGSTIIISVPAHKKLWSKHDELVGHQRRYELSDLGRLNAILPEYKVKKISYGWPWINLLRFLRVITAPIIYKRSKNLSEQKRSINSGKEIKMLKYLVPLINKYTIFPFWILSRSFNNTDRSEGYIIIFKKVINDENFIFNE